MKNAKKCFPGSDQGGFTLLEMLVAVSILAIGLLGAAAMQLSAIRGNYHADHLTEGTALAQDRMEFLMAQPFTSAALTVGNGKSDPDAANPPPSGYTVTYDVVDTAGGALTNTLQITVRVTWQDKGGNRTTIMRAVRPLVMRDI